MGAFETWNVELTRETAKDGQNHHEWLLRQQAADRDRLADRKNRGREGRTSGGRRGGGVIGRRGRGDHRTFSREVSAIPTPSLIPVNHQGDAAKPGHRSGNPLGAIKLMT